MALAVLALVVALLASGRADATHEDPSARAIDRACPRDAFGRADYGFESGFEDIAGNPHEAAIECVTWWGVAGGLTEATYGPAAAVPRDQMAAFVAAKLHRVGVDVPFGAGQAFRDVGEDNVHHRSVNALADLGVVTGHADGSYRPARRVRRDQMAAFLSRAAAHTLGDALAGDHRWFADVDEANAHFEAVNGLAGAGIAQGRDVEARRYVPGGLVRRDQIATLLARGLDLLVAEGVVTVPDAAQADLVNADGETLGGVSLYTQPDGRVDLQASLDGLSPGGFHALHLHETGSCEADFAAAGGHHAPQGEAHGAHAGDLPVLLADGDGSALLAFLTDRFTVDELLDDDGTAVVVHQRPDNYANIPDRYGGPDADTLAAGDAGGRLVCGVVEPPGPPPGSVPPSGGTVDTPVAASMVDADGARLGEVTFSPVFASDPAFEGSVDRWVDVDVSLEGLPPGGSHGFHLHETGSCQPDFAAAGGHHAPQGQTHGGHAGDLPVLMADRGDPKVLGLLPDEGLLADGGRADQQFPTDRFTIAELLDDDGTAVVVHERPDNYANIPGRYDGPDADTLATGDAGGRLACGVVERSLD